MPVPIPISTVQRSAVGLYAEADHRDKSYTGEVIYMIMSSPCFSIFSALTSA